MHYLVKGEYIEENTAGKPAEDIFGWIEMVVHPSLEMMESQIQAGKITGGLAAGERVGYMIVDAPSNIALGEWLRSFPFWGALKWTVTPLQSPRSAVDQDKVSFAREGDDGRAQGVRADSKRVLETPLSGEHGFRLR